MSLTKHLPVPGPGEHLDTMELTDERKRRVDLACRALWDWLKIHTETPIEGLIVLDLTAEAMSQAFGVRARTFVTDKDLKGQA